MKHITLKIIPEMELLGGVQAQTSWIKREGPDGKGNKYFQALKAFFSNYKGHRAVKLSQQLTDSRFTYDAPPAFICHLGPLPDLELKYEYSEYLVGRAKERQLLEDFRLALKELAAESDFLSFYQKWEPYLERFVEKSKQGFRQKEIEKWLTDFFGWSQGEFHLILAPSMFPGGGYGASVTNRAGQTIAFQTLCDWGTSDGDPILPTGIALENLTVHELSHSFVNPCIDANPKRVKRLENLYEPVKEIMKKQAYNNVTIFLYETVIRAIEILFAREFFPPEQEQEILSFHQKWGFYLTGFVVGQLEHYQANRALYPTFKEFVPYLLDELKSVPVPDTI